MIQLFKCPLAALRSWFYALGVTKPMERDWSLIENRYSNNDLNHLWLGKAELLREYYSVSSFPVAHYQRHSFAGFLGVKWGFMLLYRETIYDPPGKREGWRWCSKVKKVEVFQITEICRVQLGRGSNESLQASKQQNSQSKVRWYRPTNGPTDQPTDGQTLS